VALVCLSSFGTCKSVRSQKLQQVQSVQQQQQIQRTIGFDPALIGLWADVGLSLTNLLISVDGTFSGTLLGLGISGTITTDVTVSPFTLDLHLSLGVTIPCLYSIAIVDGVSVLTIALDLSLSNIVLGLCTRPLEILPENSIILTACITIGGGSTGTITGSLTGSLTGSITGSITGSLSGSGSSSGSGSGSSGGSSSSSGGSTTGTVGGGGPPPVCIAPLSCQACQQVCVSTCKNSGPSQNGGGCIRKCKGSLCPYCPGGGNVPGGPP
jgi:uncharacterized membrane protein YgcG